jgi:nucleotide-binding universal stress UspA family protein
VVVVRGDPEGLAGGHERILLGADESGTGAEAVRFAFREAEARGCVLDVVRAWRRPAHGRSGGPSTAGEAAIGSEEQASAQLQELLSGVMAGHPDVRVRPAVVEGAAHRVLVDRSAAADLVVVGARPRAGHRGLQLGRANHTLLHHAQCPVALVPQRA